MVPSCLFYVVRRPIDPHYMVWLPTDKSGDLGYYGRDSRARRELKLLRDAYIAAPMLRESPILHEFSGWTHHDALA
jgi:hypothetical protein